MMRRSLLALAFAAFAFPAAAQTTQTAQAPSSTSVEYLTRFAFHVSMEHLFSEEPRFVWDAQWGGDLDIVDYGYGRFNFIANYQTILGSEFRAFDPNQGNYTLEGSLSLRTGAGELAGVYHHVSRHLSDRPKRFPVDWNMIGGRISGATRRGPLELQGRADLRGVIERTLVDYTWEFETEGHARRTISPRVSAVAAGSMRVVGVTGNRNRGTQYGARGEGGVRLDGRGANVELFLSAERRIDPYQLELSTVTWLTAGFRISSR